MRDVIYLDRRRRQNARQRQEQALRMKGITLNPDIQAKIKVLEADLPEHVGWTPAEDVAGALVDLSLHPIYHVENAVRKPW